MLHKYKAKNMILANKSQGNSFYAICVAFIRTIKCYTFIPPLFIFVE
jgi:hypothetical protein